MFEQTSHVTNAISSSTNENNEIYFLEAEIDDTCEIVYNIIDNSLSDVNKTARKLHLIFGHPSADTLNKTIKLGLKGRDQTMVKSLSSAIKEYSKSCARCRELAPHKPKPKVCLPVATKFNVVAFDITFWNDPLARKTFMILHFIDLATRLSAAAVVHSKESTHIVDTLVTTWLNTFGAPKRIYTDNGGEFANHQLVELIENLGIEFKATAAESSFSNGINERHAIIKTILNKIRQDYKSTRLGVMLSYAVFAKKCLVDNHGFTPHQHVFGHSPNIPTVLSENVCSTNTEYLSDDVRKHLNLLHDTRKAYMTAESSNRIKRALNSRIYFSESPFYYVFEHVFYWKESQDKSAEGWKGPGTVIGSEEKFVVICHGSFIHRCHETKVRGVCEKSAIAKDVTTNASAITNVFPITLNNETDTEPAIEITSNNAALTQTPATVDNAIPHNRDELEIPSNADSMAGDPPEAPDTPENTITGILRPRENIKPASKWGFDEVYKVVEENDMKIAKEKKLTSWEIHGVYKEVEVKDASTPLITTRWVLSNRVMIKACT